MAFFVLVKLQSLISFIISALFNLSVVQDRLSLVNALIICAEFIVSNTYNLIESTHFKANHGCSHKNIL